MRRSPEATGLNARSRKILFAVVTEYIASGDPVGSRTLSRKYALELSPATIRNVLADLEAGLLLGIGGINRVLALVASYQKPIAATRFTAASATS